MGHPRSLVAALLLGSAVVACSAPQEEEAIAGDSARVTSSEFDRNAVLSDAELRNSKSMTAAQIQTFLEKTPWGHASVLATYEEGGQSAAEIIDEASQKYQINPLELLVRAQMEQSLIYKQTAPAETISIAFGCGCPHSPVCSSKYEGFKNQAECAAGTLSRSMDRAVTSQGTTSGWKKGSEKMTEDKVNILPKNAATAALYTYTPWVGEAGGGKKGVGGASLHYTVWQRFAEATTPSAGSGGVTDNNTGGGADDNAGNTGNTGTAGSNTNNGGGSNTGTAGTNGNNSGTNGSGTNGSGTNGSGTNGSGTNGSGTNGSAGTNGSTNGSSSTGTGGTGATGTGTNGSAGSNGSTNGSTGTSSNRGDPGGTDSEGKVPADGSDDDAILSQGNATPSSAPPPQSSGTRSTSGDDEASGGASADEGATTPKKKKKVDSGGCSVGPTGTSSSSALATMALVGATVLASRRRRNRRGGPGEGS